MELPDETAEALKRIKQLENQNTKFKNLLEAVLELANRDATGITNLQNESDFLKATIEKLENEKIKLEGEISAFLENNGGQMNHTVQDLEKENKKLKTQFENVVNKIKMENLDLNQLKAEDSELKQILMQLECEKAKFLQKLEKGGASSSDITDKSSLLKKRLTEIGSEKYNVINSLNGQSASNMLPAIRSLDNTFKHYVQALEEQTNIKEKISELEHKNEELIKVVHKSESDDMNSQIKINEEIIRSNTNFLSKIDQARTKMEEINNDFVKTLETPKGLLEDKISELENAKTELYKDLEQYLLNSTIQINKLSENISDPEIKRLINEIEIQKTVLLYSLQSVKLSPYLDPDQDKIQLPSVPNSTSKTNIDSDKLSTLNLHRSSETQSTSSKEKKEMEPSTSKDDHQKLEDEVNRLEQERERLLEQLRSISTTSADRVNDNNIVTQNERQLQTQSELHSTFMRESSHEVVIAQNYDDATNQLYADEDARLEQRIRELEIENLRIQRELDTILEEIRADKNEMSRLQLTGQVLRERIEELEQNGEKKN